MDISIFPEKQFFFEYMRKLILKKYNSSDYVFGESDDGLVIFKKTLNTKTFPMDEMGKKCSNELIVVAIHSKHNFIETIENSKANGGRVFIVGNLIKNIKDFDNPYANAMFCYDTFENPFYTLSAHIDGEHIQLYSSGEIKRKCFYVNGLLSGKSEFFFKNGGVEERRFYVNGIYHGTYEYFYPTGEIREKGEWNNGRIIGVYEKWIIGSKISMRTEYVNGKKHGMHEFFHDNRNLFVKCYYIEDTLDGPYERFYSSGNTLEKYTFVGGKINGLMEIFYENNVIHKKQNYVNGLLDGLYEEFDSHGKKIKLGLYKDNKLLYVNNV